MRALLLALLLGALAAAASAQAPDPTPDPGALEGYAEAERLYPDDPDIAWAHALALRDAGQRDQALGRLRAIQLRWPQLRPRAGLEIGRLLHERGEPTEALAALEAALVDPQLVGPARLYRALCLAQLGEREAAERELEALERSDPALRSSALLLRGLARAERGELAQARSLLHHAVEIDPSAQASQAAREALERLPLRRATEPWLGAWALVGGELDSNATLGSGTELAGIPSDQSDLRAVWSAGLLWQPLRGDRNRASLGYAYSESVHEELRFYDQQSHALFGSWTLGGRRTALRLDALASDDHLDGDRYSRAWLIRPNLLLLSGDSARGTTRLFAELERRSYHDEPLFSSLERSGQTTSAGLEQRAALPRLRGALGTLELRLSRLRTEASRDLLGFRGDYDSHRERASAQLQAPLAGRFDGLVRARVWRERFSHTNLIDALTDEGVGRPDPRRRRDTAGELTVALGWNSSERLRVELRWQGVRQRSNVDAYDYERHVLGLYLIGQHLWW